MKKSILLLLGLFLSALLHAQYAIYPQVSAEITYLAKPGQKFKKGDILVKLDARLARAELQQQQAILSIKQQQLDDDEHTFGQIQQLFDNLVRSKRELELAEIDYKQSKYAVQAQKARIAQQQLLLEKYQILAPFDLEIVAMPEPRNITNHHHPKPLLLVSRTK